MKPHPELVPWFVGSMLSLMIIGIPASHFSRNIALKKRIYRFCIVAAAVLFIFFSIAINGELKDLLFIVPTMGLITFMNLRNRRFCDTCGQSLYAYSKPELCTKCGSKFV